MYYAIVSDIHSNLEALETVIGEIDKKSPGQVICPGDIVGYGANPRECLKLAAKRCSEIVMGNHDEAVDNTNLRNEFTPDARVAIEWTAGVLADSEKEVIRSWAYLVIDKENNRTMVHSSLSDPRSYPYIFSSENAQPCFALLETSVMFFGHTHVPTLISEKDGVTYLPAGKYTLNKNDRYLINPGSVGQPRDRNTKASFAFYDTEERELEIVRVSYDNEKAARKIRRAGLPGYLADRLL